MCQTNIFLPQITSEYEQTIAPLVSSLISAKSAEEDVHDQVKSWACQIIDKVRCKIEFLQGKVQFSPSIDRISESLLMQLSALVAQFLGFKF